jgi:tetratricopeptide (TPR) repeat protein
LGEDEKTLDVINKFFNSQNISPENAGSYGDIYYIKASIMERMFEISLAKENYEKAIKCFEKAFKNYKEDIQFHSKNLYHYRIDKNLNKWKKYCEMAKNSLKKIEKNKKNERF